MNILATSGGFRLGKRTRFVPGPLIHYALRLAGSPARPRFCYVGTAVGDSPTYTTAVYEAFVGTDVAVSHLALFPMPNLEDMRAHLLAQHVVWVGGGSVAGLLAMWRLHGLDALMWEAWTAGRLALLARGRYDRLVRTGAAAGHQRAWAAAVLERRALRLRGAAAAAVPSPGRRRDAAGRVRHRRWGRSALPGHRARRGRVGHPREGRVLRRAQSTRDGDRAPDRATHVGMTGQLDRPAPARLIGLAGLTEATRGLGGCRPVPRRGPPA